MLFVRSWHLYVYRKQSNVGASLDLDGVPLFDGALELSNTGVRSHLYDANRPAVEVVEDRVNRRSRLLFDPQSAGGMLAAVTADRANAVITELHAACYTYSAVIETGYVIVSAAVSSSSLMLMKLTILKSVNM